MSLVKMPNKLVDHTRAQMNVPQLKTHISHFGAQVTETDWSPKRSVGHVPTWIVNHQLGEQDNEFGVIDRLAMNWNDRDE